MPEEFIPSYTFTDDRLNELKQIFPEAFEDGVFNLDTLTELIGEHSTSNKVKEHFGLNWMGKQDARRIASKPPTGTLKPCPGEGVNEDNTDNIFIEGENLEVLKILRKSYMGKIKMIYIDPPYNTGKDFIYNDTFADSTEDYLRKTGEKSDEGLLVSNPSSSGKYHANWLSFMYPRLRLAKDLLKEDGVIFISIDDHEIDNLRLMCDEIFGEENFVESLIWKKRATPPNDREIGRNHEYILVYSKNGNSLELSLQPRDERMNERYSNPDNDPRGPWASSDLSASGKGGKMALSCVFGIENPIDNKLYFPPKNKCWLYNQEKVQQLLNDNRIGFRTSSGTPFLKRFLSEVRQGKTLPTILNEVGFSSDSAKHIRDIFEYDVFEFTKPVSLIKTLLQTGIVLKNEYVLDFFAGSSTLAESVFELNLDGRNINFICIQIPELISEKSEATKLGFKSITEISIERIRRVIQKKHPINGVKVFKQDTSTIYKWQEFVPDYDGALPDLFNNLEMAYKNPLQDGVTTQDFITEVILQEGFPLTAKQEEVVSGIFKITHEWVPYTLYASMLYSFKDTDFSKLKLQDTDHFVCLDKAFEGNDALKQELDNQCKIFTI